MKNKDNKTNKKRNTNKYEPSQEDLEEIIRLYKERKSYRYIAKQYGVSYSTIERLLKKHNVEVRSDYNERQIHNRKLDKYVTPYARGKNPGSHAGKNRRPSPHYMHRQRKYKYKNRVPPRRCSFIRRNGTQCGSFAMAGAKICWFHCGRTLKSNNKCGGLTSKVLKRNILHSIITSHANEETFMHFLTQLTQEEVKAINSTDYSKLKILAAQHKLSDVLLTRALAFLNELELKLQNLNSQLLNPPPDANMESLYITQATLLKNITATHTIISKHQETVGKLISTQEQVTNNLGVKASLNDLTLEVSKDTLSILVDLIESYKAAGAFKNLEELKHYLPEHPAFDVVDYELLDD